MSGIDQLVEGFALPLSPDLLDFLRKHPEGPSLYDGLPRWPDDATPRPRLSDDEIDAHESSIVAPVSRFLRVDSFAEDLRDEDDDGHLYFWHREFLRFGIPCAYSSGGDPIVEACPQAGPYAGKIYLTDHDFYYDWAELLVDGEELEEYQEEFEEIELATVDRIDPLGFFRIMTADVEIDGLFIELAPDFATFYDKLAAVYGRA